MAASLQKGQIYDDRLHGTRKVKVTILASEWESSNEGLSTLNRELAIQLAKLPEVEITFFLPKCSQQDKKVALEYNVKIVQAKPVPGLEQLNWLCFPPDDLQIDIIVGHGAELGSPAFAIKRNKKCKWVQVVHTDPEELGMFKNNCNPTLKGEEKHKTEVELCEMADHVIGVGGKLSEAFRSYLRGCNKDDNVFDFTPGLFEEFRTVKQVPSERQQRSVLVFGRGDVEDFELKGFDIAGKAIAALQDTRLVCVGVTDGKREEIAKRLTECGIPASRFRVRGFVQDQDSLKRLFQEVDLVLMPSRTEGFGLPGLEAMSAGLPVLISHNSGFGEALSSIPFGSFFVVNSENPADWTQAIQKIWAKDRKSRLEEVETLQDSYGKKYNWAKQMKDLVDKMTSLAYEVSLKAASSLETKFNASSQRTEGMIEDHKEPSMENDNNPRTNSSDDEQPLSETSIGSNCEKKADAAPGNQTEISTDKGSQSQNSRKRKMSESSCDQGKSCTLKLKIRQQNLDVDQNRIFKEHFLGQFELLLELDTLDLTEQSQGEATSFFQGLQKSYNLLVRNFGIGCLEITVECVNLEGLERLWNDYQSGELNDLAERCLVTDKLKKKLNLETVQLKTSIAEESYMRCKKALLEKSRASGIKEICQTVDSGQVENTRWSETSSGVLKDKKQVLTPMARAEEVSSAMMVSDEEKRWIVVGIAMNKVAAPVLRDAVKQGMDANYANLDRHCQLLHPPCTLKTLSHGVVRADPILKNLKFQNINNNHLVHGVCNYNFNINSSLDLAKLYLPGYLAQFSAFDDSLDMTAILRLLGFRNYMPAAVFSPHSQASADDVRENVRNKWGHVDVTEWTDALLNDCFDKLKTLVRSLGLPASVEKETLDQLDDWQTKGCDLILGHAVDKDLLLLIQYEVRDLVKGCNAIRSQMIEHHERLGALEEKEAAAENRSKEVEKVLEKLLSFKAQNERIEASSLQPFDLKSCRSKLEDHYQKTATVPTSVWCKRSVVDIHQIYTRLSWVKQEQTPAETTQSELKHYTVLFTANKSGVIPKRILVQGQTGIGKSTFVKKLLVDWVDVNKKTGDEQATVLKNFELVVAVNLKEVSKCQSLKEVIRLSNVFAKEDKYMTEGLVDYISNNQEKVLLIFDGYDEYRIGRNSEIYEIFSGNSLRSCCVLITTRISKADELRGGEDLHAEITGFSEVDREEFMRRFLDSEGVSNLQDHLERRNLEELAKVPLLLLFFCTLWKRGQSKHFPKTKTSLYIAIVQFILDHNQSEQSLPGYHEVASFKEILCEIGKVALQGLLKDDHLFEYSQLSDSVRCDESVFIGLLQITDYTEALRPVGMVSFIHKSIQEFLAAWYITYRCLLEGGNLGEIAKKFEECMALENVFPFLCGLSRNGALATFRHLKSVRMSDPLLDLSKTVPDEESETDAPLSDVTDRQRKFSDLVSNAFEEVELKGELSRACLDSLGSILLVSESFPDYLLVDTIDTNTWSLVSNESHGYFGHRPSTILRLYEIVKKLITEGSEVLKVAEFLEKFVHVFDCRRCDFSFVLCFRNGQVHLYITHVTHLCCENHARLIADNVVSSHSEHQSSRHLSLKFLKTLKCSFIEISMKSLGTAIKNCNHLEHIEVSYSNSSLSHILKHVSNPRRCSLSISYCSLTSKGAVELASLLPKFERVIRLSLSLAKCSAEAVTRLVASIKYNTLEDLELRK